jgi:hypothetical protein
MINVPLPPPAQSPWWAANRKAGRLSSSLSPPIGEASQKELTLGRLRFLKNTILNDDEAFLRPNPSKDPVRELLAFTIFKFWEGDYSKMAFLPPGWGKGRFGFSLGFVPRKTVAFGDYERSGPPQAQTGP